MQQSILDLMRWRYAVKNFNGKLVPPETVHDILEAARLTPSSYGIQPWRFIMVTNHDLLVKLHPAAYSQPKLLTCDALVVVCARQDLLGDEGWNAKYIAKSQIDLKTTDEAAAAYRQVLDGLAQGMTADQLKCWTQKQCYLAAMTLILAAAEKGVDSCPMEGFKPDEVSAVLDLPPHLVPTVLVALGLTDGERPPKTRMDFNDVVDLRE